MKIGFTGTQQGMTPAQKTILKKYLQKYFDNSENIDLLHHGDCIGADAEAHDIAYKIGYLIYIHPPDKEIKRAYKKNAYFTYDKKPYLQRNHDIVNECDVLIACPKNNKEELRSGTWATIRYWKKTKSFKNTLTIIAPLGTIHTWGKKLNMKKNLQKLNLTEEENIN